MDPDGLIPLIIFALVSCFFAMELGVLSASNNEKQRRTVTGFSYAQFGMGVLFFVCCGFSLLFFSSVMGSVSLAILYDILFFILFAMLLGILFAAGIYNCQKIETNVIFKALSFAGFAVGWVLLIPSVLIFKLAKLDASEDVTEEDVLNMVDSLLENEEETNTVDENQKDMITGIFELDDVTAGDIMTHRTDVVAVSQDSPVSEVISLSISEGRSRLPVYSGSMDNITGILYIKDLLCLIDNPQKSMSCVKEFMRTAMFVPEACRARELLLDFKTKHTQIAVVVDEYGGTSGIVTMEDILEEIVGNIQDEFDNEEEMITRCEGGFICDASVDLEDLFDEMDIELPAFTEDEDFETIGGLIIDKLGRIPNAGEKIQLKWGGIDFEVLEVTDRRILKVKCTHVNDSSN